MDCASAREMMREKVRGDLEPTDAADVEQHVAGCEECRREEEAERLLDAALRERLPRPEAPASLRRRVEALASPEEAPVRGWRRSWSPAWVAALAAFVALLAFVGGRASRGRMIAEDRLADELVSDHLRVLASAHPLDVESSDSHTVKPWFEGRLDFAPVVPGDRGELRLDGVALGYVMDRKAAVATYHLRRHRLTLIAFPAAGVSGLAGSATAPPSRQARRGFEVVTWSAGDVAYALVGDVPGAELERLAGELAAETRR
jgi:anti-sigma factor RsiW